MRGVAFTLGVGFDENVPKPQDKPNTVWGAISIGGRPCDFHRHPDAVQQAPKAIDDIVTAGGRCK